MKVYTRKGDDGTTGLLYGGRVPKDSPLTSAYGAVDEAQAFIGVARSITDHGGDLDGMLVDIGRDLYVLMAEMATLPENHHKLTPGTSKTTDEMVTALEELIDDVSARFDPPTEFVVPGGSPVAAALDVARTVTRRAERDSIGVVADDSSALRYLNRLSDALWTLARWQEEEITISRDR